MLVQQFIEAFARSHVFRRTVFPDNAMQAARSIQPTWVRLLTMAPESSGLTAR